MTERLNSNNKYIEYVCVCRHVHTSIIYHVLCVCMCVYLSNFVQLINVIRSMGNSIENKKFTWVTKRINLLKTTHSFLFSTGLSEYG